MMRKNNWNRWGEEEQVGTANLIGPDRVLSVLSLVTEGRTLSLALPVKQHGIPVFGGRAPAVHSMRWDGGDYAAGGKAPGGAKSSDDYIFMGCHAGTHIDGLAHAWEGTELYNGFPEGSVRSTGAHKLGIENLQCLVTRGVLLDAVALLGDDLRPGYSISVRDVEAMLKRQNVQLEAGDVVLVRTGWLKNWLDSPDDRDALLHSQQGVAKETIDIWVEADVTGIGADNFAVEAWPDSDGQQIPFHRRAIRDYGMYLLELVDLDALAVELAALGRSEFMFMAAPLPIKGGTGSPLNPLALL